MNHLFGRKYRSQPEFKAAADYFNRSGFDESKPAERSQWQKVSTVPLKDLKITNPGKMLYTWVDVTFKVQGMIDRPQLVVSVVKENIAEVYWLNELLDSAKIPETIEGYSDADRAQKVLMMIWQYLIDNAMFTYPVEIY